jgi:hypothetical protein
MLSRGAYIDSFSAHNFTLLGAHEYGTRVARRASLVEQELLTLQVLLGSIFSLLCGSLFVLLSVFFWLLRCLSFFGLRILIIFNSSCKREEIIHFSKRLYFHVDPR